MVLRALIAAVAALGLVLAVQAWNASLRAQGYAQGAQAVRTEWDTARARRLADDMQAAADAAQQQAQAQQRARDDDQARQVQAERIAHEHAERERALRSALERAQSRQRGLLDTIAQLNARPSGDDLPGAAAPGAAATGADGAATARELLGRCSGRYAQLAADADGLRGQVMGLQDWVRTVALPAPLVTGAPDGF